MTLNNSSASATLEIWVSVAQDYATPLREWIAESMSNILSAPMDTGFEIDEEATFNECLVIKLEIDQAIKEGSKMLEVTPSALHQSAIDKEALIARAEGEPAGFIRLIKVVSDQLEAFEVGSLIVPKKHRNHKIAAGLFSQIIERNETKPLYTITSTPAVIKMSKDLGLARYNLCDLPLYFQDMIQSLGALSETDVIFVNITLESLLK